MGLLTEPQCSFISLFHFIFFELLDFPINSFSSSLWWYRSGTPTIATDCRVLWWLSKRECMDWRITPGPEAPPTHLPDMPARRAPENQGPGTGGLAPQAEGHGPQGQANCECGNSLGNNLQMWGPGQANTCFWWCLFIWFFETSLLCFSVLSFCSLPQCKAMYLYMGNLWSGFNIKSYIPLWLCFSSTSVHSSFQLGL